MRFKLRALMLAISVVSVLFALGPVGYVTMAMAGFGGMIFFPIWLFLKGSPRDSHKS